MNKMASLAVLAEQAAHCTVCPLHQTRTHSVFSKGNPEASIVFVGEAPGQTEDETGVPFCGKAGKLLDAMIGAMGLNLAEVYICNVVKCRPPNNRKPEPAETAACRPYLAQQLSIVHPKIIIAMGATAVEALLGPGNGITRRRGKWARYQEMDVMPTFHPSYLLRSPEAKDLARLDLQEVLTKLSSYDHQE